MSRSRNLVALALGLLPPFLLALFARLTQGRGFTLRELILYPLLAGSAALVAMLLVHRFFCREPLSALNRGRGRPSGDLAIGALLAAGFAIFALVAQPALARLGAPHRNPDGWTLVVGLLEHPVLMLVWFGPVLWIGVAAFEEVARVFSMDRVMAAWPGTPSRWIAVVLPTVLFGSMHYYQGLSGVVQTGAMGLVCAIVYLRRRRVWPLIVSHALYDAWSIGLALVMVSRAPR